MAKDRKNIFWALCSAGAVVVFFTAAYALLGMWPFGDKTVLTGDLNGIYIALYSWLSRAASSGEGLAYSLFKGLGGGMSGLFASIPLAAYTPLLAFGEARGLAALVTALLPLRQAFAAFGFTLYVSKKSRCFGAVSSLLGLCFALSSYALIYSQNTMFADAVSLLPFVLLALDELIERGRPLPFIATLFLAMLANYYIAYMLCLFCAIYFLWSALSSGALRGRALARRFGLFALGGAAAAGLAGFLLLPAVLGAAQSKGTWWLTLAPDNGEWLNFSLAALGRQFLFCGFTWDQTVDGLPILYCGFFCAALLAVYFSANGIAKREKLASAGVVLFMLLSFYIEPLNRVWHMLKNPVSFPFRQSFLLSAFCLMLAGRAASTQKLEKKEALGAGVLFSLFMVFVVATQWGVISKKELAVSAALGALSFALVLLWLSRRPDRLGRLAFILACFVLLADVSYNAYFNLSQFEYYSDSEYRASFDKTEKTLSRVEASAGDGEFYRVDFESFRTLNDPLLYGYRGVNHFSSLQDEENDWLLYTVGYSGFHPSPFEASAPANALLKLDYAVADNPHLRSDLSYPLTDDPADPVSRARYTLPFAYSASCADFSFSVDAFENLNSIYSAVLGREAALFSDAQFTTDGETFTVRAEDGFSYYLLCDPGDIARSLSLGDTSRELGAFGEALTVPLGEHAEDFTFTLSGYKTVSVRRLNTTAFVEAVDEINENVALLLSFDDSGRFVLDVRENAGTLLVLSLPCVSSLRAEVDGESIPLTRVFGGLTAVELPQGAERLTVYAVSPYSGVGAAVSACSLAALAVCVVICRKKQRLSSSHGAQV